MAIIKRDPLLFAGNGPLDSKSLVKTYAELLNTSTWTSQVDGKAMFVAYNGMIVAVWLNKDDTSKNGIYFLFDPQVTSAIKKPDVTNEANWHKFAGLSDIAAISARLETIETGLSEVEGRVQALEEKQTAIYDESGEFPATGVEGKIYIAAEEKKSYVWIDTLGYLCIGEDNDEPEIICGGSADTVAD